MLPIALKISRFFYALRPVPVTHQVFLFHLIESPLTLYCLRHVHAGPRLANL